MQQTTTITRNPNNARLIRVILAVYINNIDPVHGGDNSQCVRWGRWFEEKNIKQASRYICYSPLERSRDIGVDISRWLLDNWIQTKFSIESKRLVEIIYREIRFQSDRRSLSLSFLSKFFLLVTEQNFTDNKRTITKCANFLESFFFFFFFISSDNDQNKGDLITLGILSFFHAGCNLQLTQFLVFCDRKSKISQAEFIRNGVSGKDWNFDFEKERYIFLEFFFRIFRIVLNYFDEVINLSKIKFLIIR